MADWYENRKEWKTEHFRMNSDHQNYHPVFVESLIKHTLYDIPSETSQLIAYLKTNKYNIIFADYSVLLN